MINDKILVIFLMVVLISFGLSGCSNTKVCPDKTSITFGTTDVDADNDNKNKTQEKKNITQTFKWGKKSCDDR